MSGAGEGASAGGGKPRRRTLWSGEQRERFLSALRATGNVCESARAAGGHPQLFYQRRRRHADFAREWNAALRTAEAELKPARSAFENCRWRAKPLADGAADMPVDRKAARRGAAQAIRRASNGRTQIAAVREGDWTAETDEAFIGHLRSTGNVAASARAVGFNPTSVWERYRKWPGFARQWEQALEEASIELEFRLVRFGNDMVAQGLDGERTAGAAVAATPFDPEFALRFLKWRAEKARGRGGSSGRGPRLPSMEEVKHIAQDRCDREAPQAEGRAAFVRGTASVLRG